MPRAATSGRVSVAGRVSLPFKQNLTTYSEDYSNGAWFKGDCTISLNSIANPLTGTMTASTFVEDSLNAAHYISNGAGTTISGIVTTISVYAKAAGRNLVVLSNQGFEVKAFFNLATGTIGSVVGVSTIIGSSMTSVGANGWYRCSVTYKTTTVIGLPILIAPAVVDGTMAYQGTGIDSIYIYGPNTNRNFVLPEYKSTTTPSYDVGSLRNIAKNRV